MYMRPFHNETANYWYAKNVLEIRMHFDKKDEINRALNIVWFQTVKKLRDTDETRVEIILCRFVTASCL